MAGPGLAIMTWHLSAAACLALLATLTWRGLLFSRPGFAAALAALLCQWAALHSLPYDSSAYFIAYRALDPLIHAALVWAAIEAHRQRAAVLDSGGLAWYLGIAAAAVAAVSAALLLAVPSEAWGNPYVRNLQLARHMVRAALVVFCFLSCLFLDDADGDSPERAHQHKVRLWLAIGFFGNLAQLAPFGGFANWAAASAVEAAFMWGWWASGLFDRRSQDSQRGRAK